MKKLILLPIIGVFAFASCKKDYTCTCTSRNIDTSVILIEYELDHQVRETNETKAKANCDEKGVNQNAQYGADYTTSCVVKEAN